MDERKIFIFISFLVLYSLYCVSSWLKSETVIEDPKPLLPDLPVEVLEAINTPCIEKEVKVKTKTKPIPLYVRNACSVLGVFTEKPVLVKKTKIRPKELDNSSNTIAVIGITVFLVALAINAALDALKAKEEEKERRKLNPNGERRQSLAEFANKKQLRRESSRFGLQLFQIAESVVSTGSTEEKNRRQSRPYTRGDSTNSYLADRKAKTDSSTPTENTEPRLVKRQSVAKLFGARPVPMVRRSSFPALPLNPDVQALMLGHRQPSFDSDDEDGRGRRVRIIRRY